MKISWQQQLKRKLTCARRIAILGIGNIEKSDDGAGALCADILGREAHKKRPRNLKIINGGEVPENYTGDIRKFQPDHVIIIDACVASKKPGTIYIVEPNKIKDEDISTHRMSLSMLVKFLEETIGCKTIVLGIEPKSLAWGTTISVPVQKAIITLSDYLRMYLENHSCISA